MGIEIDYMKLFANQGEDGKEDVKAEKKAEGEGKKESRTWFSEEFYRHVDQLEKEG